MKTAAWICWWCSFTTQKQEEAEEHAKALKHPMEDFSVEFREALK